MNVDIKKDTFLLKADEAFSSKSWQKIPGYRKNLEHQTDNTRDEPPQITVKILHKQDKDSIRKLH